MNRLWVFGYGSLLWHPGFEAEEVVTARAEDYHRSFCMLSIHHRGTEAEPGLVLALDALSGATCTGAALLVPQGQEDAVLAYLRERELVSAAYVERHLPLALQDGRRIEALTYVIDPGHRQYCRFDLERQAQMIARATGGRGPNRDYLFNTAAHLDELGIEDAEMAWLVTRVRALTEG